MTGKELQPYPEKDDRDVGYRVAKASVGIVPFIGGYLQEVLDSAIGLPSAKRQAAWFVSIGEALQDVCNRVEGLTPEALGQNEEFQSVVATATEIAMRNHRQEKLDALRNIVMHTAEGLQIDEVLRNTFFGLVDRFSPLHFAFLKLHHDPSSSPKAIDALKFRMVPFPDLVRELFSVDSPEIFGQVEDDLEDEGLIRASRHLSMTSGSLRDSHTTPKGKAFMRFIS